jgi:beta-lactam-binding protein with PASTA domain
LGIFRPRRRHPRRLCPEEVIVPDVVGDDRAKAVTVLNRTGLLSEEQATQIEPKKVGLIVARTPKAGTSVAAGSLVTWAV